MVPFLSSDQKEEWGGPEPDGHAKYGETILVATATLLIVFSIAMVGSAFFAKASFGIFCILVSSLFGSMGSFLYYGKGWQGVLKTLPPDTYTGISLDTFAENWASNYTQTQLDCDSEFSCSLTVFGVVFTSMTGFLAGVISQ